MDNNVSPNIEVQKYPRVGIGVLIFKDKKILVGRRIGSHGAGDYSFPGGHLEYMESFEDCARRETREECGVEIKNIRFLSLANLDWYAPKHYVDIGIVADWAFGEPQNLEPEKICGWQWYDINALPDPLFGPAQLKIDAYRHGRHYWDRPSLTD